MDEKETAIVPEETPEQEPANEQVVNENESLKAFMGESYKDGLTLADVDAYLKGKKLADLSSGNYVDKKKYDSLEKKMNALVESTKDYDSLKTELNGYKEKDRIQTLTNTAKEVGIDEQFIEFALTKIDPNAEDKKEALKSWVKANPQFKKHIVVMDSNPTHEGRGRGPARSNSSVVNATIRSIAGYSQE